MKYTYFQPWVTVADDGSISVDFSDCMAGTWEELPDCAESEADPDEDERGYNVHAAYLDGVIGTGGTSPAEQLRRLADHLDALDGKRVSFRLRFLRRVRPVEGVSR